MQTKTHTSTEAEARAGENTRGIKAFMEAYEPSLREAVLKYPVNYAWPIENVPVVAERMKAAIERGTYNYDSHAFKITCRKLGIKHTRTAINEFCAT
jgi:hypothetical protein